MMNGATKKYSYIDSIRGYAVLMVLATHTYAFICFRDKTIYLSNFWVQCRMGVMLFFMISALTLFLSLEKKTAIEKKPVRNFFIRRFFRIAPLFYVICLIDIIFFRYTSLNIFSTLSFTNGFLPDVMMHEIVIGGWTLAVEMVFYVLLPVIFMCVKNLKAAIWLFLITVCASILLKSLMFRYSIYSPAVLIEYTYYWLPAQLPVFALGIMAYFTLFKSDFNHSVELNLKRVLGYFLMFCGAYFFVVSSYSGKLLITENIAFSFALLLFIAGMAINPSSFFNNKATQFLGKISYSFYLIHFFVIRLFLKYFDRFTLTGNARFVVGIVFVLITTSVISYVTYLLIEQPFQKFAARLIDKLEARQPNTANVV